jgi:hypothetical protein
MMQNKGWFLLSLLDQKIRSTSDREGDEERIVVLLIAKATKKLVRRGGTRVGEGETERRRGRKSRRRREA